MHTQKHKKLKKMVFENFDLRPLWPYRLWPCGLCNLAEILHAFQVVLKTSEYKISLHLVQKWLSYNTSYIFAMAFYLVTLQGVLICLIYWLKQFNYVPLKVLWTPMVTEINFVTFSLKKAVCSINKGCF